MNQIREAGILFSDVAGSSRLYERLGNSDALSLVEKYNAMQADVIARHGGTVVKTIGDEVMAAFDCAADVFDAAVEIQKGAERLASTTSGAHLHLHIGLHFGSVLKVGSDYFGDTVNTAAHLARLAKAQQIVTTNELANRLDPVRRRAVRDLDYFSVKGRSGGLHAVEVLWNHSSESTHFPTGRVIAPRVARSLLKLQHCGREWICDGRTSIALGRDIANDVVVSSSATSRRHASIELRGDKWILVDRSANGTFVSMGSAPTLHLHCEETILHDSGVMSLGQYAVPSEPGCVSFQLVPVEGGVEVGLERAVSASRNSGHRPVLAAT